MKVDPDKSYAVITGDFIGFSELPADDRKSMYFILKNAGRDLASAFPGLVPCDVDVFRGDGWQILLTDPALSLRAALFLRAYIRFHTSGKGIDTRMAAAAGSIDYVPEDRVSAGDGQAFRMSGKLLDQMSASQTGCMGFIMGEKKTSEELNRLFAQTDERAGLWTKMHALAVMFALKGWTEEQMVAAWPEKISLDGISKLLSDAGWPDIEKSLTVFEESVSALAGSQRPI